MRTRSIECNICGKSETTLLWKKGGFCYVQCNTCGLVFVNPQLVREEIEEIYSRGFGSKIELKPRPKDFRSFDPLLDLFEDYRHMNRMLDVGCFTGNLLLAAQRRKWDSFGTEISTEAARFAEKDGLRVHVGSLKDANFPDAYFDVVVMRDVIEHLDDPKGYVGDIERILRHGGILYFDTPNFDSLVRRVLGKQWSVFFPWHQFYFTAATLKKLFDTSDLRLKSVRSINLSPMSCYDPLRDFQQSGRISPRSTTVIREIKNKISFLRGPYRLLKAVGNIPFVLLSHVGVYLGSKLVCIYEKQ